MKFDIESIRFRGESDYADVLRRLPDRLRTWFARETGWPLVIERDWARLYK